jgi:kynurenine formamidase
MLPKEIAIYENLNNLDKLLNKDFLFVGAPLRLVGGSASPVRALAVILS